MRRWRSKSPAQAAADAAFRLALEREHNAEVQPYLPRSIAFIRAKSRTGDMIGRKPLEFRTRRKRK